MRDLFVKRLYALLVVALLLTGGAAFAANAPALIQLASEHGDEEGEEEQEGESDPAEPGDDELGDESAENEGDGDGTEDENEGEDEGESDPAASGDLEEDADANGEEDGAEASAFSAWVRSIPSDWGCIRGRLVSRAAQAGPHSGAFEEWSFDTPAEAAEFLDLSGRCVEVVLERHGSDEEPATEGDVSDEQDEVDAASAESSGSRSGKPDHASKKDDGSATQSNGNGNRPAHAGPPAERGRGGR